MRLISGLSDLVPAFVAAFVVAALISFLLTPVVRHVAILLNVVDEPNHRRVNTRPIARGGGVAVGIAFLGVAVVLTLLVSSGNLAGFSLFAIDNDEMAALFLGATVAIVIGLLDDVLNLRARW